ncbi:hypothetical protein A2230_07045 [candidate division WOR-1 bacterium RIFOXYA2_FULL_36_21]|uniref:FlgD Ig-like domain-containing protein n=1 Tax=candidate division WOR-1 bacterium RIFOXYB2_FULL_36_35 TaxID=1802578 RepID=A0A1F4S8M8_UNCSA|nr:MAG: hypothetical protein A2230_07045 [candidate division WOR-1 bacterium RIFOXYA2_FULL_36_21]OGC16764.1 MAG: hypothetical protein A2290_00200 [candidate division WOR-1 bacterium RIFOXYB2_FULL_36_35]
MSLRFSKYLFVILAIFLLVCGSYSQTLNSNQLENPYKIAVSNGYIYSVDTANNQIKKFDSSGNLLIAYGSFGSEAGQFNQPQGIAVDSNGYIYIVDTGNQRIQKLFDDGKTISFVKTIDNVPELADPTFLFPRSIRVNNDGDIFIVDTAKNRIIKYSTGALIGSNKEKGVSAQSVGSFSPIFDSPYGADIDIDGYIYIADTENNKIKKFSMDGNLLLEFGSAGQKEGQFLYPYDVAVDLNKNIYVADTGNHRIQKFDKLGGFVSFFGTMGSLDGQFIAPRGLFSTNSGYLYVVGADNKIQKLDVSVRLNDLVVSENFISPNGDGIKDKVEVKFKISEPSIVNVNVYDSDGSFLIKKIADHEKISTTEAVIAWSGRDQENKIVENGKYKILISGKSIDNKKELLSTALTVVVDVNGPLVNIFSFDSSLEAKTGVISKMQIGYQCSESSEAKIQILTAEDSIVYESDNLNIEGSKECFINWDGKDNNGNILKTRREYTVKIFAKDFAGNVGENDKKYVVDGTPPEIKDLRVSKAIFSPRLDQLMTVSFEVKDNVFDPLFNLKAYVEDENSKIVYKILSAESVPSGEVKVLWNGKDLNGDLVEDGVYKIILKVNDGVGNLGYSYLIVETDSTPPTTTAIPSAVVFSPNNDGKFDEINFKLKSNEKGKIYFKLEKRKQ